MNIIWSFLIVCLDSVGVRVHVHVCVCASARMLRVKKIRASLTMVNRAGFLPSQHKAEFHYQSQLVPATQAVMASFSELSFKTFIFIYLSGLFWYSTDKLCQKKKKLTGANDSSCQKQNELKIEYITILNGLVYPLSVVILFFSFLPCLMKQTPW